MNRETAVVSGLQWPWPVPNFAAAGSWYTFYKTIKTAAKLSVTNCELVPQVRRLPAKGSVSHYTSPQVSLHSYSKVLLQDNNVLKRSIRHDREWSLRTLRRTLKGANDENMRCYIIFEVAVSTLHWRLFRTAKKSQRRRYYSAAYK